MTQNYGELRELYPVAGQTYRYWIVEQDGSFTFELEEDAAQGLEIAVTFSIESRQMGEGVYRAEAGRTLPFAWAWVGQELHLWLAGSLYVFQKTENRRQGSATTANASGDVLAPMPGAVLEVLVSEGERVERNQTVLLLESMKMELAITAPRNAIVRRISVQAGQQVERGMRLVELAPEDDASAV